MAGHFSFKILISFCKLVSALLLKKCYENLVLIAISYII